jgi:hypothetical protein
MTQPTVTTLQPATPAATDTPVEGSATVEPAAPSRPAVGSTVEFQTIDLHTGRAVRGFGIVRGYQEGDPGTEITDAQTGVKRVVGFVRAGLLVTPLSNDVFVLSDDELLEG